MKNSFALIDKPTFFGAIALLLTIVFPLIMFPAQGAEWIAIAKTFMTDKLGFLYLTLGLAACAFMVYVVFSDMGQIKLGEADEEPEFATASWAAMLFCGGIGASILYWGCIEWAYYYQSPPFQLEPGQRRSRSLGGDLWAIPLGTNRMVYLFDPSFADRLLLLCA